MHVTTSKKATTSGELVPVTAPELDEADLGVIAGQLVEQARAEGIALTGEGGFLPALVVRVPENLTLRAQP